jgi:hypothetical protein
MRSILTGFVVLSCMALTGFFQTAAAQQGSGHPLQGTNLYADVVKYASYDNHQTASPGDAATAKWLADELGKAGFKAYLKSWKLNQFYPTTWELKADGKLIESFPAWYPNTTPVAGKLVLYNDRDTGNLKGNIAFAGLKYGGISNTGGINLIEKVRNAGAIGLVVACRSLHDSGLLVAANAEQKAKGPEFHQTSLPIPVVLVAGSDEPLLTKIAAGGDREASIKISGESRKDVFANNVVGILKRGEKWVIVTTPVSGWFRSGGERGPGVALFLGLARWIAKSPSKYSYIFIGNSGHELGYMGSHYAPNEYLPESGITPKNTAYWLHLGAAVACRSWQKKGDSFEPLNQPNKVYYLASVPELLEPAKAAFGDVQGLNIVTGRYAGELLNIVNWGYRAYGFYGMNYFFHTRMDTEKETSPELLDPVGRGLVKMLETLEPSN